MFDELSFLMDRELWYLWVYKARIFQSQEDFTGHLIHAPHWIDNNDTSVHVRGNKCTKAKLSEICSVSNKSEVAFATVIICHNKERLNWI